MSADLKPQQFDPVKAEKQLAKFDPCEDYPKRLRAPAPREDYLPADATASDFIAWCERRGIGVCDGGHGIENKQRDDLLREALGALDDACDMLAAIAYADGLEGFQVQMSGQAIISKARVLGFETGGENG